MIAHRLSTVRECDAIAVFDKGAIIEGPASHDELIKLGKVRPAPCSLPPVAVAACICSGSRGATSRGWPAGVRQDAQREPGAHGRARLSPHTPTTFTPPSFSFATTSPFPLLFLTICFF